MHVACVFLFFLRVYLCVSVHKLRILIRLQHPPFPTHPMLPLVQVTSAGSKYPLADFDVVLDEQTPAERVLTRVLGNTFTHTHTPIRRSQCSNDHGDMITNRINAHKYLSVGHKFDSNVFFTSICFVFFSQNISNLTRFAFCRCRIRQEQAALMGKEF